jgi:penicillin-binding protein 1C
MSLVYPGPNARIYIPVYMDGQSGHAIFRAVHREKETGIYWHLDEKYLGKTKTFHEMVLNPEPGAHTLILVDENGNRLIRKFRVLGKEEASR